MTRVVNINAGDKYDVYIGRPGPFGNPFQSGDRFTNIENFKRLFESRIAIDSKFKAQVFSLKGKTLGCYCKPQSCHGDVYVQFLEGK